jgi:hypothetical protein
MWCSGGRSFLVTGSFFEGRNLFDLALEVLAGDEVGNVIIIGLLVVLGHALVALGKLAEGGEGVGAELVEDARHQLSELLILTSAVNSKRVGGNGGVNYKIGSIISTHHLALSKSIIQMCLFCFGASTRARTGERNKRHG